MLQLQEVIYTQHEYFGYYIIAISPTDEENSMLQIGTYFYSIIISL